MIYLKTAEEIELQRESSLLVGKTLAEVAKNIKPGITTKALDQIAETFIKDHGATASFKGYNGFPATLCISPNDQVVHGIPSDYVVKDGDILSIDCGVFKNGFHGDSAYSFAVGNIDESVAKLLRVTKESLYKAIENTIVGKRIGDVSYAVQHYCESCGYSVVRELVGHGVGKKLHESPEVPNYGKRGSGPKLEVGMVIAIEPMINMGKRAITQEKDGWTIRTSDRKPSAHFEHTVAIQHEKADVLSSFEWIEIEIENNKNLYNI